MKRARIERVQCIHVPLKTPKWWLRCSPQSRGRSGRPGKCKPRHADSGAQVLFLTPLTPTSISPAACWICRIDPMAMRPSRSRRSGHKARRTTPQRGP